jgi:hypothetical protein
MGFIVAGCCVVTVVQYDPDLDKVEVFGDGVFDAGASGLLSCLIETCSLIIVDFCCEVEASVFHG